MVIQCKLCGSIIKDADDLDKHRKNHHGWYTGGSITKEEQLDW